MDVAPFPTFTNRFPLRNSNNYDLGWKGKLSFKDGTLHLCVVHTIICINNGIKIY